MRKLFCFFGICLLLNSCNDGDVITLDIDFDDTFSYCEDASELVLFKTKDDPSESLTLQLNTSIDDFIELDEDNILVNNEITFSFEESANTFNYRTYNTTLPSPYFCQAITPNVGIISDSKSNVGTATITTVLTEDDNDGIPADIEDANLDEDFDPSTDPTDTDGDTIPDYLDDDDDGDNVPTSTEKPNYSTTTGLDEAQDTDEDGIPDYLDEDDDGDGVLTINEEVGEGNQDPTDDISDVNEGANYLNPNVTTEVTATAYRAHKINQTFTIKAIVENFDLIGLLSQDYYDFGTLSPSPTETRTLTPDFN